MQPVVHSCLCFDGDADPQEQRPVDRSGRGQRQGRVCGVEIVHSHGCGLQPNRGVWWPTQTTSSTFADSFGTETLFFPSPLVGS